MKKFWTLATLAFITLLAPWQNANASGYPFPVLRDRVPAANASILAACTLEFTLSASAPSCNLAMDAFISITPDNFSAPFQYQIDGGVWRSNVSVQAVGAGWHNVRVISGVDTSCINNNNDSIFIIDPLPVTFSANSTPTLCRGGSTGTITVQGFGGTLAYRFSINGGSNYTPASPAPATQGNHTFTGLATGPYTIKIMDENNCESGTQVVTVGQPSSLPTASHFENSPSCTNGNTGIVTVTGIGGTSNYYFNIDGGAFTVVAAATNQFTGLSSGSHTYQVRDFNGCLSPVYNMTVGTSALSFTAVPTPSPCFGQPWGTILLTIGGNGVAPYQYSANGGVTYHPFSGNSNTILLDQSQPQGVGMAGTYSMRVKDVNGCESVITPITITQPSDLTYTQVPTSDTSCASPQANANMRFYPLANSGTPPYMFSTNNGANWTSTNPVPGVLGGVHNTRIKDANGCLDSIVPAFVDSLAPTAAAVWTNDTVVCVGQTVQFRPIGGYALNFNGTDQNVSIPDYAGINFGGPVSFTVEAWVNVSAINTGTTVGMVSKSTSAGNMNYELRFNGTSNTLRFRAEGGNINLGSTTIVNPGQWYHVAGVYDATATEAYLYINGVLEASSGPGSLNGVALTNSITANPLTVGSRTNAGVPDGFFNGKVDEVRIWNVARTGVQLLADQRNETPSGGTPVGMWHFNRGSGITAVNAITAGGATDGTFINAPFTNYYQWTAPGQTFHVSPTTVNWAFGNGAIANNNIAPSHAYSAFNTMPVASATITDANLCVAVGTLTMTVPQSITSVNTPSNFGGYNVSCNTGSNGTLNVTPAGGVSPYTITLTGPVNPAPVNGTTANFSSLSAGVYTITIMDANACSATPQTITITEPPALSFTFTTTDQTCFNIVDGKIHFNPPMGGVGPFATNTTGNPFLFVSNQYDYTLLGNGIGNPTTMYPLEVRDFNGCITPIQMATINNPPALSFAPTYTDPACFGTNGTINFNVTGGTAPIRYMVNVGDTSLVDPAMRPSGTYSLKAIDANNCPVAAQSITMYQPDTLNANFMLNDTTVCPNEVVTYTPIQTGGEVWNMSPNARYGSRSALTALTNITFETWITCSATGFDQFIFYTGNSSNVNGVGNGYGLYINAAGQFVLRIGGLTNLNTGVSVTTGIRQHVAFKRDASAWTFLLNGVATPIGIGQQPYPVTGSLYMMANSSGTENFQGSIDETRIWTRELPNMEIFQNRDRQRHTGSSLWASWNYNEATGTTANDGSGNARTLTLTTSLMRRYSTTFPSSLTWDWSFGDATSTNGINPGMTTHPYATGGNKTITMTTRSGSCSNSSNLVIQVSNISGTVVVNNVTCNGVANGIITVTPVNSVGNVTYSFTGNAPGTYTSQNYADHLAPGSYSVWIKDAFNCPIQVTGGMIVVTQPGPITIGSTTPANPTCNGGSDGTVIVNGAGGGTPPYQYAISPAFTYQSNNTLGGLMSGSYNVQVRDANGCLSALTPVTVGSYTAVAFTTPTVTHPNCFGGTAGGSINFATPPTGGVGGYTYSTNNGVTWSGSTLFSPLGAGTYTVRVRDANLCLAPSTTVTLINPAQPAFIDSIGPVRCNGASDGKIFQFPTVGTAPFTYYMRPGTSGAYSSQLINNWTGLAAGTYQVYIETSLGCASAVRTVVVTQPAVVRGTFAYAPPVNCSTPGQNVTITGTGGNPRYRFSTDGGVTFTPNSGFASSNTFSLAPATYTIRVRDSINCVSVDTTLIISNTAFTLNTPTQNPALCFGNSTGGITVNPTGGVTPYTYSINGGSYFPAGSPYTISNLAAGNYDVRAKDAAGCIVGPFNINVTQPGSAISAGYSSTNITCFGLANGTITRTSGPTGGTGGYTYSFNGGPFTGTSSFTNLVAGAYTVTIRDASLCTRTYNFTIVEPSQVALGITSTDPLCRNDVNGTITAIATGGVSPYTYRSNGGLWQSNGNYSGLISALYFIEARDANLCLVSQNVILNNPTQLLYSSSSTNVSCFGGANGTINLAASGATPPYRYSINGGGTFTSPTTGSQSYSGLTAGTYNVIVMDSRNCSSTSAIVITEPPALTVTATQVNVSCFGNNTGSIDLSVSGGAPGYTYTWSNGQVTQDITNLVAGTYSVTVRDFNNCSEIRSYTITGPVSGVSLSLTSTNPGCNGTSTGSITATGSGGTGTINYTLNGGTPQTSGSFTGLVAGVYTVVATDANACSSAPQTVTLVNPPVLSVVNSSMNVICNGGATGSITMTASGGTPPYVYYSNAAMSAATANAHTFSSLMAGTYAVMAVDSRGCSTSVSSIVITEPTAVTASVVVVDESCAGNDGSITITGSGGSGTISYSVNASVPQSSGSFTGLAGGSYAISVTDSLGCAFTTNATVGNTNSLTIALDSTHLPSNCGGMDGEIFISIAGGTAPFVYTWSNGDTTEDITGLMAGAYGVMVDDTTNGCSASGMFTLTGTPAATVSLGNDLAMCGTIDSVIIWANASNGVTYIWSDSSTADSLVVDTVGTYYVDVVDGNGCTASDTINITTRPALIVNIGPDVSVCNGVPAYVASGYPTPQSLWNGMFFDDTLRIDTAGVYYVNVVDSFGCRASDTVVATVHMVLDPNARSIGPDTICQADTLTLTANAGYSYLWSNGDSVRTTTVSNGGMFTLTATDSFGCMIMDTVRVTFINQPDPNPIIIATPSTNLCPGTAVTLNAGGGYFMYSWNNGISTDSVVSVLSAGSFAVTVWNGFGCSEISDTVRIVAVPGANPTITPNHNILSVSPAFATYQWYFNNNPIIGANGQTYNATVNGDYKVVVTDVNGCTGTTTLSGFLGIEDNALMNGLSVYPNPTNGKLFLTTLAPIDMPLDIVVTDMNGRVMKTFNFRNLISEREFDLSDFANGMYLFAVHTEYGSTLFKVVVK